MKRQFDSNQAYQLDAIAAVVDVFDGQPLAQTGVESPAFAQAAGTIETDKGHVANHLALTFEQILRNVQSVQQAFNDVNRYKNDANDVKYTSFIPLSTKLDPSVSDDKKTLYSLLNFTIEMETGTGKTYTYLRTIYELNKMYGFKKFVIVVPSVPIKEGVMTSLQMTHEHLQDLYGHPPLNYRLFERQRLATLSHFAAATSIEILVINIDSFAKDNNVIHTLNERGVRPIDYIQNVRPIVIIDEPQNINTDLRKHAIANLNPLCTIGYSATHKQFYNLLYSLNPVQAYDLGLVKHIEVDGITTSDNNANAAFIQFKGVTKEKTTYKAKIVINVDEKSGLKSKGFKIGLSEGDKADLYELSNKRDIYKGYELTTISYDEGYIEFSNGVRVYENEAEGSLAEDVMKYQIERTIKHHLKKIALFHPKGIKILSLFFIDRVANYRGYADNGVFKKGKFAEWFEQGLTTELAKIKVGQKYRIENEDKTFTEVFITKAVYDYVQSFNVGTIHNGYFSSDKLGKGKEKKEIWTDTKGTTAKDEDTYTLIMRDKEKLLRMEEPLQFIFSHSALREGWDNPNVFQICTLNETKSTLKKRQEIGRGLRLPVDTEGVRMRDKNINVLTVVANESYEDFSKALQKEIQEETGVDFKNRVTNAQAKVMIKRNKDLTIEAFPMLFDIWEKINQQTRYSVEYSTDELIRRAVERVKAMPPTQRPMLESKMGNVKYGQTGIVNALKEATSKQIDGIEYQIPDVYAYIQNKLDITRQTIYEILIQSDKYAELAINPQMFLDNVVACIRQTLNTLLVDGVKYTEINGRKYAMDVFEKEEIEAHLSRLFAVTDTDKTVFNYVPIDSKMERDFARDCEADSRIKFFFKLPRGFKIPTPIGDYVPDWAVLFEGDSRLYIVVETKDTLNKHALGDLERLKIACAEKHFAVFKPLGVDYQLAVTTKDLT